MVVSNNIGLVDVVFRKGNTLAGANGATSTPAAEAFARSLAKSLPRLCRRWKARSSRHRCLFTVPIRTALIYPNFPETLFFSNRGLRWAKN